MLNFGGKSQNVKDYGESIRRLIVVITLLQNGGIYQMMLEILISILREGSLLQAQSIEEQSTMFVCDDIMLSTVI